MIPLGTHDLFTRVICGDPEHAARAKAILRCIYEQMIKRRKQKRKAHPEYRRLRKIMGKSIGNKVRSWEMPAANLMHNARLIRKCP